MKQSTSIKTTVMIALAGATFCSSLPALDYKEDFSSDYVEGPLVGQKGWKTYNTGQPSPNITADPETKALHISGNPAGNTWVKSDGEIYDIPADGKITLLLRASLGSDDPEGRNEAALGIGPIEESVPAMITILRGPANKGGVQVRQPKWGSGNDEGLSRTSNGLAHFIEPGQVYEIRSVWDLAANTATLEYRNVSAGDEDFIPLYSDRNAGSRDFPLGITHTAETFQRIFLRIGGDPENKILGFSITDSSKAE